MKSLGAMIAQLDGMVDTNDLTDWENTFVSDVCTRTACGKVTTNLSEKQVDAISKIYRKHFGDAA